MNGWKEVKVVQSAARYVQSCFFRNKSIY